MKKKQDSIRPFTSDLGRWCDWFYQSVLWLASKSWSMVWWSDYKVTRPFYCQNTLPVTASWHFKNDYCQHLGQKVGIAFVFEQVTSIWAGGQARIKKKNLVGRWLWLKSILKDWLLQSKKLSWEKKIEIATDNHWGITS